MTRSTLPLVLMLLMFCAQLAGGQEKMVKRRVLYNFDGDSCMFTRTGSKGPVATTVDDIKQLIAEVAFEESQVDTVLVCINAQVMYYPTQAGTLRGTNSTEAEREKWPASEKQRFENMKTFFDAGVDPYAMMLAETRRRGREALLTFRVNDAHGNDFLRTQFWSDHPEWRLGNGALDFSHEEVRDYVFGVIEEAVQRYDCDGIELDFNRFPTFFKAGSADERVAKMNSLVERVRKMLNKVGKERGRRLILAARVATNYGRTPPDYKTCREIGCDPAAWATSGWIDFLTVSEFLFERYDLPIKPWKELMHEVPIYGGIECTESGSKEHYLTPAKYRRAARHLWNDGADGIYLFNFFTTREYGAEAWEPPFEVLTELGDRARVAPESIDLAAEHSAKGIRFVGGEWRLVDGLMQQVSQRDSGQAFFPNRMHKDTTLDFQFYVHPEGDGVRAAGAIVRSADSESFYGVHFDTRNDQVVLYVSPWHDKPDWIVLARNTVSLEDSRWYAARVEAIGNKINVSLNGRALLVTENERYQAGLVGLYSSQGRVDFRDVRIDGTPGELASAWRDVTPPRRYQIVTSGESAGGYAAFPDLGKTKSGDLLCVFYSGYGHVSKPSDAWPKGGRVMATRSTDQGQTWQTPFVLVDTVHDDRDPHIAALADGTLLCNWFAVSNPQQLLADTRPLTIFVSKSTDEGKTWSEPAELKIESPDWFACSAPIRELPDGSWILGLYTENQTTNRVFGGTIKSYDRGKTWTDLAAIGAESKLYLDAETDVIRLKDGKLLAALRSSKTDLYFATSADEGKNWSEVRSSGFAGHCPHFLRHSNGAILLTHRIPATAAHWSLDEGQTWQGPFQIDSVGGAYPSCVELPDQTVYCVYYEEGQHSSIRGMRLKLDASGLAFQHGGNPEPD